MALIKVLRGGDLSAEGEITSIVVRRALNALLEPWIADAKTELAEQLLRTMPTASEVDEPSLNVPARKSISPRNVAKPQKHSGNAPSKN